MIKRLAISSLLLLCVLLFITWSLIYFFTTPLINLALEDRGLLLSEDTKIELNLFRGKAEIRDLNLYFGQTPLASMKDFAFDIDLSALFSKKIQVDGLHVKGLNLAIGQEGEELTLSDIPLSQFASQRAPSSSKEEVSDDKSISHSDTGFNWPIRLQELSLTASKITYESPELNAELNLDHWGIKQLAYTGPKINLSHRLEGHVALGKKALEQKAQALEVNSQFALKHKFNANLDSKQISLKELDVSLAQSQIMVSAMSSSLDTLKLRVPALELTNNLTIPASPQPELMVNAQLELAGLLVTDKNQRTLLDLNSLVLDSIVLKGPLQQLALRLKQVDLTGLTLMVAEGTPTLFTMDSLSLIELMADQTQANISEILIGQFEAQAVLTKEKVLSNLYLPDLASNQPKTRDEAQQQMQAVVQQASQNVTSDEFHWYDYQWNVGSLKNTGPLALTLKDLSQSPSVNLQLDISQLLLQNMGNHTSEGTSELIAKVQQYGGLQIKGIHKLGGQRQDHTLDLQVTELDLPALSPYVAEALGYEIESGQLDTDIQIAIKDAQIQGQSKTLLKKVELSQLDQQGQQNKLSGGAISFNAALGMLKDSDGTVELNIPISGDLNNPSVGMQGLVSLVIKRATMMAAKDYLITTFVPYSKIVSIVLTAGDTLLKMKFTPMQFDPAQTEFNENDLAYLNQLAQVLIKQDKVKISLCGEASYQDLNLPDTGEVVLTKEQKDDLLQLGQQRADLVKAWLVKNGDIASNRLFSCAPKVSAEPTKPGRLVIIQL